MSDLEKDRDYESMQVWKARLERNIRRRQALTAIASIVEDAPNISGTALEHLWESAAGLSLEMEQ